MHINRRGPVLIVFVLLAGALFACAAESTGEDDLETSLDPKSRRTAQPSGEREGERTADSGALTPKVSDASTTPDAHSTTIGTPLPAAPSCVFDTRAVYMQAGKKYESITANGQYWSREVKPDGSAAEGVAFPKAVLAEAKFANGPCAGTSACDLDTRTIRLEGATKLESTTAYGLAWEWGFAADGTPQPRAGFPQPLSAIPPFAAGPCAAAGGEAACKFNTRVIDADGSAVVETITAYGRLHRYAVTGPTRTAIAPSNVLIESVARYAAGPCRGQTVSACKLDTHAMYRDADGVKTEEITAQGRLWVFRFDASGAHVATPVDGVALVDVPRLTGPCK